MIKLQQVTSGYPQKEILSKVSISIPASKMTVILGPNGCGKSTLLKTISGILPAQSGKIFIYDKEIHDYSSTELARKLAYLPQNPPVPDMTVERLVLQGRFPYLSYPKNYRDNDFQIAHHAMKQLGIETLADVPLNTLSGGTRQKVYLAMALAQSTDIILLDEPTTHLDISYQLQIAEYTHFLCDNHKTAVMVLHDLPMAMQIADWIIVMNQGNVVQEGTPEEIFASRCLDSIFHIKFNRLMAPLGWQYYCIKE